MTTQEKRGAIAGGYVNRAGEQVWIVAWSRGRGSQEIKSENPFEPGQAVTLNADGALVRIRAR